MRASNRIFSRSLACFLVVGWLGSEASLLGAETPRQYWILLKSQPQEEIVRQTERAAELQLSLYENRLRAAAELAWMDPAGAERAREAWVHVQRDVRAAAFAEIERLIGPEQEALRARIENLGGRLLRRYLSINLLLAELPPEAADELAQDERVARVWPDPGPVPLGPVLTEAGSQRQGDARWASAQLYQPVQPVPLPLSIGAGALWEQGINGRGEWIALLDSGVHAAHPMFRGVRLEGATFLNAGQRAPGFADTLSHDVDRMGGGTMAASLLVGQGMSGGWEHYRGIAWGAAGLLSLKCSFRAFEQRTNEYLEYFSLSDVLDAWDWLVSRRPEVKIAVALPSWFREYFATAFDLFIPTRTGKVPESRHLLPNREGELEDHEGGAPSVLTVATLDARGTAEPADDVVSPYSARGPASGGRRKPDVAAPGTNFWAARHDGDGMTKVDGTTAPSAELVGGAAALLRQAGVREPLALKALFINTAGRTQWDKEWGWGAIDLQRAYSERRGVVTGQLATGRSAVYRFEARGQTSATLVWKRSVNRGAASNPDWSGCLANLDLRLYRAGDGALLGSSTTPNDSVERVIVNATGPVLAKVSYSGTTCRPSEPFALAINSDTPPAPLAGPSLAASCAAPPQVVAGQPFTLTCTLRNTGDLGVSRAVATLQVESSAAGQLGFGALAAGASSIRSITLTAPAAAGRAAWRLDVTATALDDPRTASVSGTLEVVAAGGATRPVLAISPAQVFVQARATDSPVVRTVRIANSGAGSLTWTASSSHAWVQVNPASGNGPAELSITVQPNLLPAGTSVATVSVSVPGLPAQALVVIAELIGPPASGGPSIAAVVNGASFQEGFSPSSWVTIRGSRLAPRTRIWREEDIVNGQLPLELDGVRVNIGGRPAVIYYISPDQLNVLAPDDDSEGPVQVEVSTPEGRAVATAQRRRWSPGIFTYQAGGRVFVAAVHAGYPDRAKLGILVGPEGLIPGYPTLPLSPGDAVQIYLTGLGVNTEPRVPYQRVLDASAELRDDLKLWIGGREATVLWKGLVAPGLYQINVLAAPDLPAGEHAVEVQVGGSARVRSLGTIAIAP